MPLCSVDTEQFSNVIANRVSVSGSKLYLDGLISLFVYAKVNLAHLDKSSFLPNIRDTKKTTAKYFFHIYSMDSVVMIPVPDSIF